MTNLNIQRDAEVFTADGKFGTVAHVIVDQETREVTDLVVAADGHEYLVPMGAVTAVAGDRVNVSADSVRYRSQPFDHDRYQTVSDERVRAESHGEARHGGAPLRTAADDAIDVASIPAPALVNSAGLTYRLQRRTIDPVPAAGSSADRVPLVGQRAAFREGPVPDAMPLQPRPAYQPDRPLPLDNVPESPQR